MLLPHFWMRKQRPIEGEPFQGAEVAEIGFLCVYVAWMDYSAISPPPRSLAHGVWLNPFRPCCVFDGSSWRPWVWAFWMEGYWAGLSWPGRCLWASSEYWATPWALALCTWRLLGNRLESLKESWVKGHRRVGCASWAWSLHKTHSCWLVAE
jgi:hypothetical protein